MLGDKMNGVNNGNDNFQNGMNNQMPNNNYQNNMNNQMGMNNNMPTNTNPDGTVKTENMVMGIVGAVIGSLAGVISIIIFSSLGFVVGCFGRNTVQQSS